MCLIEFLAMEVAPRFSLRIFIDFDTEAPSSYNNELIALISLVVIAITYYSALVLEWATIDYL